MPKGSVSKNYADVLATGGSGRRGLRRSREERQVAPNSVREWLPLGATGEDKANGGVKLPENVTWNSNDRVRDSPFATRDEKFGSGQRTEKVPKMNPGVSISLGSGPSSEP